MTNMEKLQQILDRGTGHKRHDDDLFQAVDGSLKIYRREGIFEIENFEEKSVEPAADNFRCNVNGCALSFTSMAAYDSHYNSNHRYTCIYCRKLLQSAHLLDMHLSETHDNFFSACSKKKPMFKCFIETCHIQFWNAEERNNHCTEAHKISKNFLQHFGNKKNNKKSKAKKVTISSSTPSAGTGLENMSDLSMIID